MSYTELFKVLESEPMEKVAEFGNAFRGAFLVWDNMAQRYLSQGAAKFMTGEGMRSVWDLAGSQDIFRELRIVLITTFDNVMVRRERLNETADAFDYYYRAFDDGGHLDQQARKLRELAEDATCFAVCWNQTSVNADTWWIVDETKDSDDDDYYRRYDISRDEGHWFLFDELQ